jgi:pseudouridylate synthase
MELAAAAGVRVFATGGIGGVHRGYGEHLDVSADLLALTRFPVAVVASGVKSILDVEATREALEALGIPVIGFQTDSFPAFYIRETAFPVDARFDDAGELAGYVDAELRRTGRGVLIVHPVPRESALDPAVFEAWVSEAQKRIAGVRGRDLSPALLAALHEISGGVTLQANRALVRSNADLAAHLCAAMLKQS